MSFFFLFWGISKKRFYIFVIVGPQASHTKGGGAKFIYLLKKIKLPS